MNRTLIPFLAFLAILVFSSPLSAQEGYQNIIKTNPFGLAFGNFNATYERVLGSSSSILVSGRYFYKFLGVDVNTAAVELGYRFYFTHAKVEVPTGFYINPLIGYAFGSSKEEDISYGALTYGAELGYQWAFASGFTLDLGIGPVFTTLTGDAEDIDFDASGLTIPLPSITIALGFAF